MQNSMQQQEETGIEGIGMSLYIVYSSWDKN